MTQEQVTKLLGRSLTAKEAAGFDVYVDIARAQLEAILGMSLEYGNNDDKTFTGIEDYTSLIVPPFTEVYGVKRNGVAAKYTIPVTGKPFCYEIVLAKPMRQGERIIVEADWGYCEIPNGVYLLWAQMFAVVANGGVGGASDGVARVKRETVLSHTIEFDLSSAVDVFRNENSTLIDLYSVPKAVLASAGRRLWIGDDDDISRYRPYY